MIGPDPKPKVACVAVRVNSVETASEGGPHSSPSKPSILRDTGIEKVKPKKSVKFVLNDNTCHTVPTEDRVGQFRSRSFTRDKSDKYSTLQDQNKAPLKDTPSHAYKIAKATAKIPGHANVLFHPKRGAYGEFARDKRHSREKRHTQVYP